MDYTLRIYFHDSDEVRFTYSKRNVSIERVVMFLRAIRETVFYYGGDIRYNEFEREKVITLELDNVLLFDKFKEILHGIKRRKVEPVKSEIPELKDYPVFLSIDEIREDLRLNIGSRAFMKDAYRLMITEYKKIIPNSSNFEFIMPFINTSMVYQDGPRHYGVVKYGVIYLDDNRPTFLKSVEELTNISDLLKQK